VLKRLLEYVELYASKGFVVIPLKPMKKIPAVRWKEYQHRKPTDRELKQWFGHGRCNIGIVTGRISDICVIDFDSFEAYRDAKKRGMPHTPTVRTAKGYHLYYRYPHGISNLQNCVNIAGISGIDLRADGGYVVAPPSVHPSGVRYEWIEGKSLDDLPLAELPEWVMEELETPSDPPPQSPHRNKHGYRFLMQKRPFNELLHGVNEGERNHSMTRIAGWLISHGYSYQNSLRILLKINQRNRPPLPSGEVKRTLQSITKKEEHRIRSLIEMKMRELQPKWEKAQLIF